MNRRQFVGGIIFLGITLTFKTTFAQSIKHPRRDNRRMRKAKRSANVDRYVELYTDQAVRYSNYTKR